MFHRALLLFDIDATLLVTSGAGMRAMVRASHDVFGPHLSWDGIELSGGIDPVLITEAARRSRVEIQPGQHDVFKQRYLRLLVDELRPGVQGIRALPGVPRLVESLRAREDVALGIVTGNYGESAVLKLAAVGLDPEWFPVTAFADDGTSRPELVRMALRRYERIHEAPAVPGRVIVLGDTPRDVDAALRNGCIAFAVATGKYSTDVLRDAGAHVVVQDFTDPEPLERVLQRMEPTSDALRTESV